MRTFLFFTLFSFFLLSAKAQGEATCSRVLSGTITNHVTSEKIAGVDVKLFIQGEEEPEKSITVGDDASYSFTLDCSKRYVLEAGKENYTINRKIIYPSSRKKDKELDLVLFAINEFKERDTNKLIDVGHVGFETDGSKISPLMRLHD
jgi:hypothetical protein